MCIINRLFKWKNTANTLEMRKKVLFMIGTLQSGGVSKSLVNLLNVFDRQKYEVHLMLMCTEGNIFGQYLPEDIILHTNRNIDALHSGLRGLRYFLMNFNLLIGSIYRMILSKISKARAGILMAHLMPNIFEDEEFELIVDYGGQQQLYYMVDKLHGKKKITFFHNDYSKWPYYFEADRIYYKEVDGIYTISQTCVDALVVYFPEYRDKIGIIENISSPKLIYKMAEEKVEMPKSSTVIVTLGHICKRKGTDFALEAAGILKGKSIDFKWLFIGKIIESAFVTKVRELGLEKNIFFLGIKSNPYPYIKAADIFVLPSRFEGKSIALDEAKILCKPIVVTNFSTVNDQFENRVNASICEMGGRDLADKIEELINDEKLRNSYINYLEEHISDNSSEVNKLYKFL
uniref:Glycosyltransferase n=1 Tax=Prevotella sp. GTC17260 TaxID=3236796 RepID=A0AB33JBH1_9BACT